MILPLYHQCVDSLKYVPTNIAGELKMDFKFPENFIVSLQQWYSPIKTAPINSIVHLPSLPKATSTSVYQNP